MLGGSTSLSASSNNNAINNPSGASMGTSFGGGISNPSGGPMPTGGYNNNMQQTSSTMAGGSGVAPLSAAGTLAANNCNINIDFHSNSVFYTAARSKLLSTIVKATIFLKYVKRIRISPRGDNWSATIVNSS